MSMERMPLLKEKEGETEPMPGRKKREKGKGLQLTARA